MPEKPTTAEGYDGTQLEQLTTVGGLVPSRPIEPTELPAGAAPHVGKRDLDLGLQLAVLNEASYRSLAEGLRGAGFVPDVNARGNRTPQRWVVEVVPGVAVPVDFLIPLRGADDRAGRTAHIEPDFKATIVPGLELADRDRVPVTVDGVTVRGERAGHVVQVCGPGAFVVLESPAFQDRGENKDAYDLDYVVQH